MPRGRYSPRRHDVHEAWAAPLWIDTETVSAWAKVRSVPSIVSVVVMVSGVFLRGTLCAPSKVNMRSVTFTVNDVRTIACAFLATAYAVAVLRRRFCGGVVAALTGSTPLLTREW